MNRDELDRAIDGYLQGELNLDQAARLEEHLASPKGSEAFSQELLVRDFLYNLPPETAPAGLIEQIQSRIPATAKRNENEIERSRWEGTQVALAAVQWAMLGPAIAVRAPLRTPGKAAVTQPREGFVSGVQTVLRFSVSSGRVVRFGANSGKALRLATHSGKALRLGLLSGRTIGSSVSTVAKVISNKKQSRPRWRRAFDWIR